MKKFVLSISATKRGSRLSRLTNHRPDCPPRFAVNAIFVLSGDQRALVAFQSAASKGEGVNFGSVGRRCEVAAALGTGAAFLDMRTSHGVLTVSLPPTVP